jgi:hypothetical protein
MWPMLVLLSAMGRVGKGNACKARVCDPDGHYHDVRNKWFDSSVTHSDGHVETRKGDPPWRRADGAAYSERSVARMNQSVLAIERGPRRASTVDQVSR